MRGDSLRNKDYVDERKLPSNEKPCGNPSNDELIEDEVYDGLLLSYKEAY